jgi:hypothetical protein
VNTPDADYVPYATIGQARVLGAPISQFWALALPSLLAQVSAAAAVDSCLLP